MAELLGARADVQRELQPGGKLLWSAQPSVGALLGSRAVTSLFGIVFRHLLKGQVGRQPLAVEVKTAVVRELVQRIETARLRPSYEARQDSREALRWA